MTTTKETADIVERLRSYTAESTWDLLNEAADEIERLRKENNAQFKYIEAERSIRIKLDNEIEKQDAEIERLRQEVVHRKAMWQTEMNAVNGLYKEYYKKIERLREALRQISLLPCEWVVHEIAVAALKEPE